MRKRVPFVFYFGIWARPPPLSFLEPVQYLIYNSKFWRICGAKLRKPGQEIPREARAVILGVKARRAKNHMS
jgi:hypothetical protein